MAIIHKEQIQIDVLRLVKQGQDVEPIVTQEILSTLEEVAEQLVEGRGVVEVNILPKEE